MEFFSEETKNIEHDFITILRSAYNYDEALKRHNLRQEDIDRFREKLKGSKFVPKFIVDKQLLPFLNFCPNDIDKCVQTIETFYNIKQTTPEFFSNRDVNSREIQESLDHQDYVPLPMTSDNCGIIFHRLSSFDPNHYVFDEACKTFITTCEAYAYDNGPLSGVILIFDLRGATFSHMFKPSLSTIRKGLKFIQEGCPFDIRAVHVLNTVPFFDIIVGLVKPLTRSELFNKVHFHSTSMDFESFYKEWVPKSHLPSDLGGDLESVETLHKTNRENLMKLRNYFLMEEQQWNFEFDSYINDFGEDIFKSAGYF